MRINQCTISLQEDDIKEAIQEHIIDSTISRVQIDPQSVKVTFTMHFGTEWNVDAEVFLHHFHESELVLQIKVTNIPLLRSFIKDNLLAHLIRKWNVPGIEYRNGLVHIDLDPITKTVAHSLVLQDIKLREGAIDITLDNIVVQSAESVTEENYLEPEHEVTIIDTDRHEHSVLHEDTLARLRAKTERYAHRKLPKGLQGLVPWLLLVPDIFVLMLRLMRDPRVPSRSKLIVGGALAYILSPINLIPNFIPFIGELDDLAVGLFALEQLLNEVPIEVVQDNWPGDNDVVILIREGTRHLNQLLSRGLMAKVRSLLAKNSVNDRTPGL